MRVVCESFVINRRIAYRAKSRQKAEETESADSAALYGVRRLDAVIDHLSSGLTRKTAGSPGGCLD